MYAITPNGVGRPVGARKIQEGWPLVDGETFTTEEASPKHVLAADGVSLRLGTDKELAQNGGPEKRVNQDPVVMALLDEVNELRAAVGGLPHVTLEDFQAKIKAKQ